MKPGSAQPRPGGGFNQGLGNFNEHLDEQAMQQAMKQKALAQQGASQSNTPGGANIGNPFPGTTAPGGTAGANPFVPVPGSDPAAQGGENAVADPSIFETIIEQPVEDLAKIFLGAMKLDTLLGFDGSNDTPEVKAQKNAMHKRFEQLESDQKVVAQQLYQEAMQRKQAEQQEEAQRKQIEEQKRAASIQMPSSPQKGQSDPNASRKSHAVQKLEQDRKTLSGPQSVG